jgi:hypothetical protein
MRKNVITRANSFKLSAWLTSRHTHLIETKPTCQHVADLASEELGFTVTEGNIRGMLRDLELKVDFKSRPRNMTRSILYKRMDKLKEAMITICMEAGLTVPLALKENW